MLRQYFNCNERLEIFLTCLCDILCYLGNNNAEKVWTKYEYMNFSNFLLNLSIYYLLSIFKKR